MGKFNAGTTAERLDRIEEVLGIAYKKEGNVETLTFGFGALEKVV